MGTAWLNYPVKLNGQLVRLLPLEEEHLKVLYELAEDKRIWEFYPFDGSDKTSFLSHYSDAFLKRDRGSHYPFVVIDRITNKNIGSTSFCEINAKNRNLEIGWTWLHPTYWTTKINLECKYLLLTYCFDVLKCIRVQFRTNDLNIRSQKAIRKIGAKFEGILRNVIIRGDGMVRSVVYYSIIDEEWEEVSKNLVDQLA